ncbi:Hsf-type dna-binding protein, partial [Globisporangium splendens]
MQLIATRATTMSPMKMTDSPNKADKDVAPFLKNLRKMLDLESDEILRWTPNGRAFEIHDMEQMMDYVLPKYFKHRKYTSFQRQLNYFNFRKWTKSKAVVCTFSNEYFLRDQPELAWRITRKKSIHQIPQGISSSSGGNKGIPKPRPNRILSLPPSTSMPSGLPRPPYHIASHPYWMKAETVGVSVARSESLSDSNGRMPFPSPTDNDTMLKEHDHASYRRVYFGNHSESLPTHHHHHHHHPQQQQHPESMDWIDCLLPPVDRIEDEIYTYMYPSSSSSSSSLSALSLSSSTPFVSKPYECVRTSTM